MTMRDKRRRAALNRRGQVVWKASPQMLDRLADAEAEVEAEYQNER
jgi:hypothetical protein